MDPLSVLGTAFSVAQVTGAILNRVVPFVNAVPHAEGTVRRFVWTLRHLKAVMLNVGTVFEAQLERHTFRRKDWTVIDSLLHNCNETIRELSEQLPELPAAAVGEAASLSMRQQALTQLKLTLRSKMITDLQLHLSSSVEMIQLSLQTMSLAAHQQLHSQLNHLTTAISKSTLLNDQNSSLNLEMNASASEVDVDPLAVDASGPKDSNDSLLGIRGQDLPSQTFESFATTTDQTAVGAEEEDDIGKWRSILEKYNKNRRSVASLVDDDTYLQKHTRMARASSSGDSGYGDSHSDLGLIVPTDTRSQRDSFSADMLSRLIEVNLLDTQKRLDAPVPDLEGAMTAQKKAIEHAEERAVNHKIPFTDRAPMKETLATIYNKMQMYDSARQVLEEVLKGEKEDTLRFWDLHQALANVLREQGNLREAATYANRAFNGREEHLDRGDSAIIESLQSLASIYDELPDPRIAEEFRNKLRQHQVCRVWKAHRFDEPMQAVIWTSNLPQAQNLLSQTDDTETKKALLIKAFHWAVEANQRTVAEELWVMEPGIDIETPNQELATPLISAAACGHRAMVEFCLDRDAGIEARDNSQNTALMRAAEAHCSSVVELLLERHADPHATNIFGRTALHLVQCKKSGSKEEETRITETAAALIRKNADIEAKSEASKTALHEAAEHGNEAMVKLLLELGAEINTRDIAGRTALHIAVDHGWPAVIVVLFDFGADPRIVDGAGRDAFKAAKGARRDWRGVQQVLEREKRNRKKGLKAPTRRFSLLSRTHP